MSNRNSRIAKASNNSFDVVIIGGGIYGATLARELSLRAYNVLLLEAKDWAYGTSSRSSKLLHGGIRYLEQGAIGLVRQALKERAIIVRQAPHLARPQQFISPVIPPLTRPNWQIGLGLCLYDFLQGKADPLFPKHKKISLESDTANWLSSMGLPFEALYSYFDAQMDDSRLVLENVLDAESLGATVLNYSQVKELHMTDHWEVNWQCAKEKTFHVSKASFLINAAGPWVKAVHSLIADWPTNWPTPVFSRGTHLVFDRPWQGPGLILPTGEKGRYYFVLPHYAAISAGTLVGTTDVALANLEDNPQASLQEIDELLGYLQRDLPSAGLDSGSLVGTFAGVRILTGRISKTSEKNHARVSTLSREDMILEADKYLLVLGGKYTTARAVAEKVCDVICEKFRRGKPPKNKLIEFRNRPLLGGKNYYNLRVDELSKLLLERIDVKGERQNFCDKHAEILLKRYGARAVDLIDLEEQGREYFANENVLDSELRYVVNQEQAEMVEDVVVRRLCILGSPPLELLSRIEQALAKKHNKNL